MTEEYRALLKMMFEQLERADELLEEGSETKLADQIPFSCAYLESAQANIQGVIACLRSLYDNERQS